MTHPLLSDLSIPSGPWDPAIGLWKGESFNPVHHEPWGTVLSKSEWRALARACSLEVPTRPPGLQFENRTFGAGTCFGTHYGFVPYGLELESCAFGVGDKATLDAAGLIARPRWLLRLYDAMQFRADNCAFFGTTPRQHEALANVDPRSPGASELADQLPVLWEHGDYSNVAGNHHLDSCLFVECAAQAVQLVFRENHETIDPSWATNPGVNALVDSAVLECGRWWGKERAGFAVSFFETGQEAALHRTLIRNVHGKPWEDGNGVLRYSSGALLVEGRPRFDASECLIEHRGPDKELVKLDRVRRSTFTEVEFRRSIGDVVAPLVLVAKSCGVVTFDRCRFPEGFEIRVQGGGIVQGLATCSGEKPTVTGNGSVTS